jgi:hypothetical protein
LRSACASSVARTAPLCNQARDRFRARSRQRRATRQSRRQDQSSSPPT